MYSADMVASDSSRESLSASLAINPGEDMNMTFITKKLVLLGTSAGVAAGGAMLLVGGAGSGVSAAPPAGPVARYEMRAGTVSGMGAMGAGGHGGMGAAFSMAFGGGGSSATHELWLELGSTRAPADGQPKADHFMPPAARLGPSVALKTPVPGVAQRPVEREFQRPKGRMLIFWGCGEHAPAGQPVIIDFAKIAAGQMPPGLWTSVAPLDRWVSPTSSRTYGHWPADDGKSAKPESSLLGAHSVAGNYSPTMNFTLTHDFMGALHAGSRTLPSGAPPVSWNALGEATGYHLSLMGGKGQGQGGQMTDMVWWSSSATREFGGGLADWLSPATVARLVASRTVLSPQTTSCTIPAEVKQAAPDFMFTTLYAYGLEEDFAYPPRPANPKIAWTPEWTARIRHRSMTTLMPGMPGMDGASAAERQQKPQCQPKRKRGFGGLGGLIGGALGVPGGNDGC